MIIVMKPEATTAELEAVKNKITDAGLNFHLSQGSSRTIVGVRHEFELEQLFF